MAASFWATAATGALLGADFTDGMTSQAMQQGGMGLILTALIMTTPPMAAAFFQGTLGQFTPYGAFAHGAVASGATGHPSAQIDYVLLSSNGQGLFAVQGRLDDPAHHKVHVDRAQAIAQPIAQSTVQLAQEVQGSYGIAPGA